MFAAIQSAHERHRDAIAELSRRLELGESMVVPAHAAAETYSAATRAPHPYRPHPSSAWEAIRSSFVEGAEVASLSPDVLLATLDSLSRAEIGGGRVYDALIAATCVAAEVDALLTFNVKHFLELAHRIEVVEPPAQFVSP